MDIQKIMKKQKAAAKKAGRAWWFEVGALRFFDTRFVSEVFSHPAYSGHYFVTSEQCHHSDGTSDPRLFTVRCWDSNNPDGISTIGKFQQYQDLEQAERVARAYSRGLTILSNTD